MRLWFFLWRSISLLPRTYFSLARGFRILINKSRTKSHHNPLSIRVNKFAVKTSHTQYNVALQYQITSSVFEFLVYLSTLFSNIIFYFINYNQWNLYFKRIHLKIYQAWSIFNINFLNRKFNKKERKGA